MKFIKSFFIPNDSNKFHPHSTRHYALLFYTILFLVLNLLVFPVFGIKSGHVIASDLDANEIIQLTNKEREQRGLKQLINNPLLEKAAKEKGRDMFAKQYWNHYGPSGESPWNFIINSNYDYIYAGENLAKDFSNNSDVISAWMNSPTHKANILNTNFQEIGIAIVNGSLNGKETTIIVQLFGTQENRISKDNVIENITEYVPQIIYPQDNFKTNNFNINISGESKFGDSILVYSNNKLIGEIPNSGGIFNSKIQLNDEKNMIQIKSQEKFSGKSSQLSKNVNVSIDTLPPDITDISIELYEKENEYILVTNSNSDIHRVILKYKGNEQEFEKKEEHFVLEINKNVKSVEISYIDEAGNISKKEIDIQNIKKNLDDKAIAALLINTEMPTIESGYFDFMGKIFGLKDMINTFLIFTLLFIIIIDAVFILKDGHIRDWTSHHGFHISLIMIVFLGIIVS